MEFYQLNNGMQLPKLGLGTFKLTGNAGVQAMTTAIDQGYRLLDTAYNYENEGAVGAAIRRSSVPRSALLVASKLPGRYYKYSAAITAIQESLFRSGLDYFDLYLLHWPNPRRDNYVEAWRALIAAQQFGLVRTIGVCNFLPAYLDRLATETGVMPSINQIELHPYFNQATMRQANAARHILTADWSPLGRASAVLADPVLKQIAATHHKEIGQVILRWDIQHGTLPLPKSQSPQRQAANLAVFDFSLTSSEMTAIDQLTKANGRTKGQDPAIYEEF